MSHHSRPTAERFYMSLWHVGLISIGVWEWRHHKTFISKVLAGGMILFHVDACISDALDTPKCLSRFLLERATGVEFQQDSLINRPLKY